MAAENKSIAYHIMQMSVSENYDNVNSFMYRICLIKKYCIMDHFNNTKLLNEKLELSNKAQHFSRILIKPVK